MEKGNLHILFMQSPISGGDSIILQNGVEVSDIVERQNVYSKLQEYKTKNTNENPLVTSRDGGKSFFIRGKLDSKDMSGRDRTYTFVSDGYEPYQILNIMNGDLKMADVSISNQTLEQLRHELDKCLQSIHKSTIRQIEFAIIIIALLSTGIYAYIKHNNTDESIITNTK